MTTTTGPQLIPTEWTSRIASLVHTIRPDWDKPGIRAALHQVADRPLALATIAATIAATTRTDQRTPAIIALDGDHWTKAHTTLGTTPRPLPIEPRRCAHGMIGRECPACQASQDTRTKEGVAKVRAAHRNRGHHA